MCFGVGFVFGCFACDSVAVLIALCVGGLLLYCGGFDCLWWAVLVVVCCGSVGIWVLPDGLLFA